MFKHIWVYIFPTMIIKSINLSVFHQPPTSSAIIRLRALFHRTFHSINQIMMVFFLDPRSEGLMKYPVQVCPFVCLPVPLEFFFRNACRNFIIFCWKLGSHLNQSDRAFCGKSLFWGFQEIMVNLFTSCMGLESLLSGLNQQSSWIIRIFFCFTLNQQSF